MADIFTKKFRKLYSLPLDDGVKKLYRFSSFNPDTISFHKALFEDGLLYHNLPSYFNDPFECQHTIQWPRNRKEEAAFLEDVMSLLILEGSDLAFANRRSQSVKITEELRNQVEKVILAELQKFRFCCFTKCKENLLFWSHYANSHTGYCVEYSTDNQILSQAYKINYSKKFPTLEFPLFGDIRKLAIFLKNLNSDLKLDVSQLELEFKLIEPVLNKSIEWKYEEEYRSVLMPGAPVQLSNNGDSLILKGNEIKNVYFGCNMPKQYMKQIIHLIEKGPFTPRLWQASMKSGQFSLVFHEI